MTDNKENKEGLEPERKPAGAAPAFASEATINRAPRKKLGVQTVVVVGGLALAVGYVGYSLYKQQNEAGSRISRAPNVDGTPAGQQLAESERYKQSLDAENQRNAELAQEDGSSFIATPDEPLRSIDSIRDVTQEPQPRQRPVAPPNQDLVAERQQQQQQERRQPPKQPNFSDIDQLAAIMQAQAGGLAKQWVPQQSVNSIIIQQELYQSPQERAAAAEQQQANAANGYGVQDPALMAVKAGQILYARTVNASDSDTPGPVIAEIFQNGPLYRARLIGTFQQNTNTNAMIVQFNRIVLASGEEIQTQAYAIDGTKGSIAVRSELDRRWLERYGPRLAGAFVSGLGAVMARSSQQIVIGNNTTTVVDQKGDLKDALYAGAGRVGDQLATEIEGMAPSGPLVILGSGYTIGILFMQGVPDTQSQQNYSSYIR